MPVSTVDGVRCTSLVARDCGALALIIPTALQLD